MELLSDTLKKNFILNLNRADLDFGCMEEFQDIIQFSKLNSRFHLEFLEDGISINFNRDIIEIFFLNEFDDVALVVIEALVWMKENIMREAKIMYENKASEIPYVLQNDQLQQLSKDKFKEQLYFDVYKKEVTG